MVFAVVSSGFIKALLENCRDRRDGGMVRQSNTRATSHPMYDKKKAAASYPRLILPSHGT